MWIQSRKSDLPEEFCENSFKLIDEFIKKTSKLDYEILLYFDYMTGEMIFCSIGASDNVKIVLDGENFIGKHIASIHNHPVTLYSPPSDKNFGILLRDFEDYELIVGSNELWILKAKGVNSKLNIELKVFTKILLSNCQDFCNNKYGDIEKSNEVCDKMYGIMLS